MKDIKKSRYHWRLTFIDGTLIDDRRCDYIEFTRHHVRLYTFVDAEEPVLFLFKFRKASLDTKVVQHVKDLYIMGASVVKFAELVEG